MLALSLASVGCVKFERAYSSGRYANSQRRLERTTESESADGFEQYATASDIRFFLDTLCNITIFASNAGKANELLTKTFELLAHYESLFSITIEGSDIWRINHAGSLPVAVSTETIELLEAGIKYSKLSSRKFDITIGRLTRLWDFSGQSSLPDELSLSQAIASVGYKNIVIDGETVTLTNPYTWIDLGGIAKGFMLDRLAGFLRSTEIYGAVIDLGGDIIVIGEREAGRKWRLGVRNPFGSEYGLIGIIKTSEASVITSGIYERQFEYEGVSYHHILDPSTGMPARSDIVSATVVSESALAADALTSIALHLYSDDAYELLRSMPEVIGAILVLQDGRIIEIGNIDFTQ